MPAGIQGKRVALDNQRAWPAHVCVGGDWRVTGNGDSWYDQEPSRE